MPSLIILTRISSRALLDAAQITMYLFSYFFRSSCKMDWTHPDRVWVLPVPGGPWRMFKDFWDEAMHLILKDYELLNFLLMFFSKNLITYSLAILVSNDEVQPYTISCTILQFLRVITALNSLISEDIFSWMEISNFLILPEMNEFSSLEIVIGIKRIKLPTLSTFLVSRHTMWSSSSSPKYNFVRQGPDKKCYWTSAASTTYSQYSS